MVIALVGDWPVMFLSADPIHQQHCLQEQMMQQETSSTKLCHRMVVVLVGDVSFGGSHPPTALFAGADDSTVDFFHQAVSKEDGGFGC
jgi:hypothetical protein